MNFELRLLSQSWIDHDPNNTSDLCTHGTIHLKIGAIEAANEEDGEWTVSTSALTMLRSAISDYTTDETAPMIHHCGQLMMMGCPISICWTVRHNGYDVVLSELRKQPTTNSKDRICYLSGNESVTVRRTAYIRDILRFSDSVAQFLDNGPAREFEEEHDRDEYSAFLDKFNSLRGRARDLLEHLK